MQRTCDASSNRTSNRTAYTALKILLSLATMPKLDGVFLPWILKTSHGNGAAVLIKSVTGAVQDALVMKHAARLLLVIVTKGKKSAVIALLGTTTRSACRSAYTLVNALRAHVHDVHSSVNFTDVSKLWLSNPALRQWLR